MTDDEIAAGLDAAARAKSRNNPKDAIVQAAYEAENIDYAAKLAEAESDLFTASAALTVAQRREDEDRTHELRKWITQLERDIAIYTRHLGPIAPKPVTPGHPDAPMPAARSFVDAHFKAGRYRKIHFWQSAFMVYVNGVYTELSEDALRSLAWPFFEYTGGAPLKSKQVAEILKALEADTYLPEKTPVPCWLDAPTVELPDLLICQNGAFDLVTGDVHALTPRLFATIRLPVDYSTEAQPPGEWLKFLASVWPDDQDSIDTLQEVFGLMLTPITKFQKIFLLVGPKRSGKGTILRTLRKLLGPDNVAAPALSTIADPFGMECLIGKLAALIGDARINARADKMSVVVERLLSISGEDSPNVARKHLKDWTGRLPTRIVMSSNELPHLDDPSGAMASRFVILVLRESFIGREDLELESKLAPEMPAILRWAIEGRGRLLARGRFVQPASGAASVEQMAELSSSVAKFVRECCAIGPEQRAPKDALYQAWRTWCATNGERPTQSNVFARDLLAAHPRITSTKMSDPATGKRVPTYAGIGLVDSPSAPRDPKVQEFASFIARQTLPAGCTPVKG
jgi:putative DNA primase/helicase